MEISPIIVSMKTASVSIVITFFLGLAAAYGVERIRSRKLQLVCDGILTLPLVLPPTVAGFFLLYIFGVKRPVGRFFLEFFGTKIAFSWQATVLAAVLLSEQPSEKFRRDTGSSFHKPHYIPASCSTWVISKVYFRNSSCNSLYKDTGSSCAVPAAYDSSPFLLLSYNAMVLFH